MQADQQFHFLAAIRATYKRKKKRNALETRYYERAATARDRSHVEAARFTPTCASASG